MQTPIRKGGAEVRIIGILLLCVGVATGASLGGKVSPGQAEIAVDLPEAQQLRNVGGSDGAGLCVFTSITHAARWQRVEVLEEFQRWMRKYPGGGWPEKVTQKINAIAKEKGIPPPLFLQAEGRQELLPLIESALKSGRLPSVTYAISPTNRYGRGARIAHMVNVIHLDDKYACVLDNNFPGVAAYEWMTRDEFYRSLIGMGGSGWVVVLLDPGPPPMPWNKEGK